MRKYKAPGTYAKFIPTSEPAVISYEQQRVMAIVGTGQQSFVRKNVLIDRSELSIFDKLPDENVISIESITSKAVGEKNDPSNKLYADYTLESGNLISWNRLLGPAYDASVNVSIGQGSEEFVSNVMCEVTNDSLVTNDTYKIEISNVGPDGHGTYYLSRVSDGNLIGEFIASIEPVTAIPGVTLKVLSTSVLLQDKEFNKMGDFLLVNTSSPKCHVEPIYKCSNDIMPKKSPLRVEHGGSHYSQVGYEFDKNAPIEKLPTIANKVMVSAACTGVTTTVSLFKDSVLSEVGQNFDKFVVVLDGRVKGKMFSKTLTLFDALGGEVTPENPISQSSKVYDLTAEIGGELSTGDFINVKYVYLLKNDSRLDESNLVLQLDINKNTATTTSKGKTSVTGVERLLTLNNGIFVRDTTVPHTVGNPNDIFSSLIKNVKISSKDSVKTGEYLIKIDSIADNKISIFDNVTGELLGNWSANVVNKFKDAIPGIYFELYPFRDTEGLIEMNGTKDLNDLSGCGIIFKTAAGVINPGVPQAGTEYYITYKYAKAEKDYEPIVYTNYKDIVAAYGKYLVTDNGEVINGISLAAEIAMSNGASPLVIVQSKSETEESYSDAIERLGKQVEGVDNVNVVVALSSKPAIKRLLVDHINKYSTPEYNMYRMGYVAADLNEPATKESNVSSFIQGSVQNAIDIYNERIVYVTPGAAIKSITNHISGRSELKALPGHYLAVAVGALSVKNDPAEPLTNKTVFGFYNLVNHYSEPELNLLSSNGCLALKQEGNVMKVRHGVTTHSSTDTLADIQSNEITLVQIKDYVINGCRKTLGDAYVGGKLKPSIVADMEFTLKSLLGKYITDSIIINYEDLIVARDQFDPRQVNITFLIEAVYPLNYIDITFGFSTTIS